MQIDLSKVTHAFAVPGEHSIIDTINPVTKRSAVYGETLDEVRLRYPGAQRVLLAEWQQQRAAQQDVPLQWEETTATEYDEMLNALPPALWEAGLFLVGEPTDHHALSGQPRFQVYRYVGARYLRSNRPMTRAEALAITR